MSLSCKSTISILLNFAIFVFGFSLSVSVGLQAIAMVLWLVLALLSIDVRPKILEGLKNEVVWGALLFFGIFLLGTLWSKASHKDVVHMLTKMDIFLIFPIIYATMYDVSCKKSLYIGFAIGVMLSVVLSLLSHVLHNDFYTERGIYFLYDKRVTHIFHGHTYQNYFAGLFITGLIALLLTKSLSKWQIAGSIILILLCGWDIFFVVGGRGGQILFVLMLILLFLQWRIKIGLLISGVILLVVLPMLMFFSPVIKKSLDMYHSDISQYKQGNSNTSMGYRLDFHNNSMLLIKRALWFGHGTGSFNYEYAQLKSNAITTNPHNDYLWIAIELGLFGLAVFIIWLGIDLFYAYLAFTPYNYLAIILIVTYIVACLQNSFFSDRITGEAFVAFLASFLAGTRDKNTMK
ncbi:MAG: hypothetical protein E6Q89_07175 [Bacteroidia bacterium]|nr:MAG: hypothetical protein E6Q89_07175 [Bacteroidia bacterium]